MINIDDFDIIIFDADATLRRCTVPNQPCPNADGEWELLPGVKERIQAIDWSRRTFGIASNQAGVALGYLSEEQASKMLADCALACMANAQDRAIVIELCPHAVDARCECRKPKPAMLFRVIWHHVHMTMHEDGDPDREFDRACERALYIGDLETDEQAARAAGVRFAWAWDFFGKTREEWVAMLEAAHTRDKQRVCAHATPHLDIEIQENGIATGKGRCIDCRAVVDHARPAKMRRYACDVVFDNGDRVRRTIKIEMWLASDAAEHAATAAWQHDMGEVDAAVRVRDVDAGTEAIYEVTIEPDLLVEVRGLEARNFCHLSLEEATQMIADAKPIVAARKIAAPDRELLAASGRIEILVDAIRMAAERAKLGSAFTSPADAILKVGEMADWILHLEQKADRAEEEASRLRAENESISNALTALNERLDAL